MKVSDNQNNEDLTMLSFVMNGISHVFFIYLTVILMTPSIKIIILNIKSNNKNVTTKGFYIGLFQQLSPPTINNTTPIVKRA